MIDKKSLKVVLVDDDDISSFIYRKIIEKSGVRTDHVKTFLKGEEGLEYLTNNLENRETFPDLILLDINMPIMDGWGFLEHYGESIYPNLEKKVVLCMLSSSVYQEDIKKAYSYPHVNDYVTKPLTVMALENLLAKHFGD